MEPREEDRMELRDLPDNILLQLLALIRPEARARLSPVCRRWRFLIKLSWNRERESICPDPRFFFEYLLPRAGRNLRKVRLNCLHPLRKTYHMSIPLDEMLSRIAASGPEKLEELTLSNFQVNLEMSPALAPRMALSFTALESFCFDSPTPDSFLELTDEVLMTVIRNLPALKRLKVRGIPMASYSFLPACNMSLEEFHLIEPIVGEFPAVGAPLHHLMERDYSTLTSLALANVTVPNREFQWFCERALNLKSLFLKESRLCSRAEMPKIGLLRSLERLSIVRCWNLVGDKTVALLALNCSHLRFLTLHQTPITDFSVCSLSSLRGLKELDLSQSGSINDWSLITTLPKLGGLEALWLCNCDSLQGLFLPMVFQFCPRLRKLGLSGMYRMSKEVMRASADLLSERARDFPLRLLASETSFNVSLLFSDESWQNLPLNLGLCRDESEHNHDSLPPFPLPPTPPPPAPSPIQSKGAILSHN